MSWQVITGADRLQHVVPERDMRPHRHSIDCWCRPSEDEGVVVHNAMDERERYEEKAAQ